MELDGWYNRFDRMDGFVRFECCVVGRCDGPRERPRVVNEMRFGGGLCQNAVRAEGESEGEEGRATGRKRNPSHREREITRQPGR